MRIVIDLQGAQSHNSRNRGVGRYTMSLARAIICNKGEHEIIIALNGLFPDTIGPIRAGLSDLLPQSQIRVWHAPGPVSHVGQGNTWHRKSAELIRESFLVGLQPDVIFIASLFEGFGDDAITSIGPFTQSIPTAVSLYDLIPLINRKLYLDNPVYEEWYENKLEHLRRADLLLAISSSSRQESIDYLGFPADRSINVSTAADPQFKCISISAVTKNNVRARYGLSREFVMYTGGIDHRKNIEGLIRAYAKLPESLRKNHQLAVVCSVQPGNRLLLEELANQQGLGADELILTGYVPEEDLIALYHLCKAFVFPSWHEGFGLPALEAMSCGAPVIAANTSSLPEVVGWEGAMFDPRDDNAITQKLAQVLTDSVFRDELVARGLERAKQFSWDQSAKVALAAIETLHATRSQFPRRNALPVLRPKLAYISPLPPERSGIAGYSAELLPELARHYQVDVIVAQETISDAWINQNCPVYDVPWFISHAHEYDRVLYHFGNSHFHQHMFDLLEQIPGVVVLHDFFLSGVVMFIANKNWDKGAWESALYANHGYSALIEYMSHRDAHAAINKYPCNRTVLEKAQGVIVHSESSKRLAKQWLGENTANDWTVIPLLRVAAVIGGKAGARQALGLSNDAFMVCSYGLLGYTKQNKRLLDAWLASSLVKDPRCMLVFVGQNDEGDYGQELLEIINNSGFADRILITGWTESSAFCQYLESADIAVQLRTHSRGETSAAVLDCMNYGLPTIVNANGSMADLQANAVWMIPDEFEDADLIKALEALWVDDKIRSALARQARETILEHYAPSSCSAQYAEAIERYFEQAKGGEKDLFAAIVQIPNAPVDEEDWLTLAQNIAQSQNPPAIRQLLVDISALLQENPIVEELNVAHAFLHELLTQPPSGFRTELVYGIPHDSGYRYARKFVLRLYNYPDHVLVDEVVEVFNGDLFLGLNCPPRLMREQAEFHQRLRNEGVLVDFVEGTWSEVSAALPHKLIELSKLVNQVQVKAEPIISQSIVFDGQAANEVIIQLTGLLTQSLEARQLAHSPGPKAVSAYITSAAHKKMTGSPRVSSVEVGTRSAVESILAQSIVFEAIPTTDVIEQFAESLSKTREAQQLSFNL